MIDVLQDEKQRAALHGSLAEPAQVAHDFCKLPVPEWPLINPRRACARVTVVDVCVCQCICLFPL